jgi:hypothetical protein
MSRKSRKRNWLQSMREGDIIGIRWPEWPYETSGVIKRIGILLCNHDETSTATVMDPVEGEILCLHEQLFPIVKFIARHGE